MQREAEALRFEDWTRSMRTFRGDSKAVREAEVLEEIMKCNRVAKVRRCLPLGGPFGSLAGEIDMNYVLAKLCF